MKLSALTVIAFHLNGAIDTGRYDALAIEDVREAIRAGTIFSYLRMSLGIDIDLSLMDADIEAELLAEWQNMEAAIDARRTFGVARRGLPLLVAFVLEGIQRRARAGA